MRLGVRYLYTFLFYLILPFVFLRLIKRSIREPNYRKRFSERLGYYPLKLDQCIWVHAVSMGETIAAIPLIKALKAAHPTLPLLVTTMTPSGSERVKTALGDSVYHVYLPYDLPAAVSRFLNAMQPKIAIIMETELWPNLLAACCKRGIPTCLVNARLSAKSAGNYQNIAPLTRAMLNSLNIIAANGEQDATRFIALGALQQKVVITGNIKFDLELPADLTQKSRVLREALGNERFIWIAASTHEGEEEVILAAHKKLREQYQHALLILVPRHADRFNDVALLCEQQFKVAKRSQEVPITNETAVYLGDTMGELLLMYGASDVAFVGGSLIPRGGHNILEPGALEKPVLTGPHLFNFAEISELFLAANAMVKVADGEALSQQLVMLAKNETQRVTMGQNGKQVVDANRGALERQLQAINKVFV